MDYKKLIKSRMLRIKLIQLLNFIPDKMMVKLQYRIKTGHKLNLTDPRRFTEKLQAYKLFYQDPLMKQCVDKFDVREYVGQCGLEHILNHCYGVYNHPDEIDFDVLPQSFVLKDTLGSGGNSVIIVKDKTALDLSELRKRLLQWVNEPINKKHPGREWVYDGRKHRIIIEKYIPSDPMQGGLIDYKIFCFNGCAKYLYVVADRIVGSNAELGIYDENCQRMNVNRCDERPLERQITKPANFETMKEYANKLSAPFPEARIDFYNLNGSLIFGEITFFDGSGYMTFMPDEFDYVLGACFVFPQREEDRTLNSGAG